MPSLPCVFIRGTVCGSGASQDLIFADQHFRAKQTPWSGHGAGGVCGSLGRQQDDRRPLYSTQKHRMRDGKEVRLIYALGPVTQAPSLADSVPMNGEHKAGKVRCTFLFRT